MRELHIEERSLEQIDDAVLAGLEAVYSQSYYNTHMYADVLDDMERQPEVFKLFTAQREDRLIGARVIESKRHDFIDYHGRKPIHGKRFAVLPEFRGLGVGSAIIQAGNRYAFNELDVDVVFGESNEVGALSLYGRHAALYALGSVEKALRRNSPDSARRLFGKFLVDRELRDMRFPEGHGIQFVYCRDQATKLEFEAHGFVEKKVLMMERMPQAINVDEEISLRTITDSDKQALFSILGANPDIKQHVAWTSKVEREEDVIPRLESYSDEKLSGRYAIWSNERIVGYIGMSHGESADEYGIGYFLDGEARGKGVVGRAITGLTECAQQSMDAKYIYLQIKPDNNESVAVAKRLGFYPAETVMGVDFPVEQQRWRFDLK